MKKKRPITVLGLVLIGVLFLGALAALLFHRVSARAQQALQRAEAPRFVTPLHFMPPRTPATQATMAVLSAPGDAYDAAFLSGRLYVATSGGILLYNDVRPGGGPPRLLTQLDGLPSVALRSLLSLHEKLLVGDNAGALSFLALAGHLSAAAQIAGAGAIIDGVFYEDSAYLLVRQLGLLRLDGEQLHDLGKRAGLDLSEATALCAGPAGLYVATAAGALFQLRGGHLVAMGAPGLLDGPLLALACDGEELLIGTATGLHRRRRDGALSLLLPDLLVTTILPLEQEVLVGTLDDGVHRLLREGSGLAEGARLLPGRRVHRLRPLTHSFGDGQALALCAGGTFVIGTQEPRALPGRPGLSGPHVTALSRDGAGRLWIGTFENGLDLLLPGSFPGPAPQLLHRPRTAEPRSDSVNAILAQKDTGEMLVATAGGIDVYGDRDEARPRRIGPAEGLLSEQVQALSLGALGLWVATGQGLSLLPPMGPARGLSAFQGLLSNRVYALAAAGEKLYVGTLGGLSIVQGGRVVAGHGAAALGASWVSALCHSGDQLYIGTYGGGLSRLRGVTPERIPGPPLHVNPGALHCDKEGLWAGTREAGLVRYEQKNGLRTLDVSLLPTRSVTAILAEGQALWVGTEAGLLYLANPQAALAHR